MNLHDHSPPTSPSPDKQRDALRKGLGRAVQWAMTRRLEDGPLLEACLRDRRFDTQVEQSRGDWLWEMIRAVDAADRFRVPILHALYASADIGIALLPPREAKCIRAARVLYSRILDVIEANDYDVFATRARVPTWQKAALVARTMSPLG